MKVSSIRDEHSTQVLFEKRRGMRTSILGLLQASLSPRRAGDDVQIEDIRAGMLHALGNSDVPNLGRRIRHAADVEALWYLRGDLMRAMADTQGEYEAKRRIDALTRMFQGLLPRGMRSRPSPLED